MPASYPTAGYNFQQDESNHFKLGSYIMYNVGALVLDLLSLMFMASITVVQLNIRALFAPMIYMYI